MNLSVFLLVEMFATVLKALKTINMREILINLPEELVEYLDESPYIGDRSKFIVMLIKRWQRESERSRCEIEQAENDPQTLRHFLK